MTNSANLKDDNGKYAKLPICPICGNKVHIDDNDVNMDAWSFTGDGEFAHDKCFTKDNTNESGYYWNGEEMVYEEEAPAPKAEIRDFNYFLAIDKKGIERSLEVMKDEKDCDRDAELNYLLFLRDEINKKIRTARKG